jgi:predicted O-methyltransferase YrrM
MITALGRGYRVLKTEGPAVFFRKAAWWVGEFFRICYATVTVRIFAAGRDPEQLADLAFQRYGGSLRPWQNKDEIVRLVRLVKEKGPETVLEIGTACGGSLLLFCHAASARAKIISVDIPYGMFGGGYPAWRIPLYRSFACPGQDITLIRDDSHEQKTLDKIKSALAGRPVDFLFIDGDHTYEGVKKDFEMYSPLVRKNGIIALHDIVLQPPETGGGVNRFWEEIKARYRSMEIMTEKERALYGIGVLYVE